MIDTVKQTKVALTHSLWGTDVTREQFINILAELEKRVEIFGSLEKELQTDLKDLQWVEPFELADLIVKITLDVMKMTMEEVIEKRTHNREKVKARKLITFFVKKYTPLSLMQIAELLGLKMKCGKYDHPTVLYYDTTVNNWKDDRDFKGWITIMNRELIKYLNEIDTQEIIDENHRRNLKKIEDGQA